VGAFFSIDEIREQFTADMAMIRRESVAAASAIGSETSNNTLESLEVIQRHGHTLKGIAGMVNAQGLRAWGDGMEKLGEYARGWLPESRKFIFRSIAAQDNTWEELTRLTLAGNMQEALELYHQHRKTLPEEIQGYFMLVSVVGENPTLIAPPLPSLRLKPSSELPNLVYPQLPPLAAAQPLPVSAPQETGNNTVAAPITPKLKAAKSRPGPAQAAPVAAPTEAEGASVLLASPALPNLRHAAPQGTENLPLATPLMPPLHGKDGVHHEGEQAAPPPLKELLPSAVTPHLRTKESAPAIAAAVIPGLKVKTNRRPVPAPAPAEPGVDLELLEYFQQDAEEQVRSMERAVLRWEKQEDVPQQIQAVRRAYHTLKGAANSVGLTTLGKDFHAAEDYIQDVTAGKKPASPALFQFLLRSVDQLRDLMGVLKAGQQPRWQHQWAQELVQLESGNAPAQLAWDAPEPVALEFEVEEDFAVANAHELQVRVDAGRVNELGSLLSQVVTDRRRVEDRLTQFRKLTTALQERTGVLNRVIGTFQKQFEFQLIGQQQAASPFSKTAETRLGASERALTDEFSELEFDRYDEASILSRSLAEIASDLDQLLGDWGQTLHDMEGDSSQFKQTSREIQEAVGHLTLVAFDDVAPRLQRVFRDAAELEKKEVRIDFRGTTTRLDKGLVERAYPALLHLVRNAVAHGIEPAERRQGLGKEPVGRVTVSCSQVANQILICVEDDGGGIDELAVRKKAFDLGLWHDEAQEMSANQLLRVLCHAGFSTVTEVSELAGRGVGMDVVRAEIDAMNGSLELDYQVGFGTRWSLRLPLTLSISEGVVIRAGKQRYALPLNSVLAGVSLEPDLISRAADGSEQMLFQGQQIPLLRLSKILQVGDGQQNERGLVIASVDKCIALTVDELIGRSELPIRPLDAFTACHPLFESGTIDASGEILPILAPHMLVKLSGLLATAAFTLAAPEARLHVERPQVLVVDDSVSVRKVQQAMLQGLDCDVVTAVDGLDGLDKLRSQSYDIILTDLEMPRLNGYELIAEIRSNPAWARTPVIVISSRTTDKHVARAMNLGATSFLFKPFNESQIRLLIDKYVRGR
jgi:chemosensory pili system protein ChpA (sensor histidine kinase/response regulator)